MIMTAVRVCYGIQDKKFNQKINILAHSKNFKIAKIYLLSNFQTP